MRLSVSASSLRKHICIDTSNSIAAAHLMSVAHDASAGDEIFRIRVVGQKKKRRFNRAHIHLQREKEREGVKGSLITYMNELSLYLKILFIRILPYFALNNTSYDVSRYYLSVVARRILIYLIIKTFKHIFPQYNIKYNKIYCVKSEINNANFYSRVTESEERYICGIAPRGYRLHGERKPRVPVCDWILFVSNNIK